MAGLDETRPFRPVRIAVMAVSDTRTLENDRSGQILVERATQSGHQVVDRTIVPDDRDRIVAQLQQWIADPAVEVAIATGGTGLTGRDVTPEAFQYVYEKEIPGFGELFRWLSYGKIGTATLQSRATAGVAKGTYLFALPGSSSACQEAWDDILRWQLDSRFRPCNLVDLMPRLQEHQLS
jgi:molybdenum cofactor biosynthesis protein B